MQELTAKPILLIFVAIYAVVLVIVGAYYSRETKTSDEFVLAGKGLGTVVLIGTFLATYTGNGTISGGGNSLAYTYGLWPGIFFALPAIGGITSNGFGIIDVKRAIEKGYITGSRIVAAPRFLCSAGSHGDLSQGFAQNPELSMITQNMRPTLGAGKDFFVNAVREEIKYGADFIKIMATGGFFTPYDNPSQQQLNDEELQAIMATAHEWGKTVTAHVYSVEHMKKLIQFGIDGMEHCSLMNEEVAQMIIDNDIYVVPTFCPYEEAVHYDPVLIQTKQEEYRIKLEYYKDALQAGREVIKNCKCKLGYGTDMVATHQNYESGYEFKAWMESGMGTFRTLHAATRVNSEILQLDDKIGTIETGKLADIAAWKRDLMTDPYALLDCAFVMKEGIEYQTEPCEEL